MAVKNTISSADLAQVGKGTPAGEWFRRYWVVVGISSELRDIPEAVKVLGEELVLFRDGLGRAGLLGLYCPHRGTSLEYGEVEPEGLRCPYHGWAYRADGQCYSQPGEPKGSTFYQRVRHLAYPVREQGGLLFAYLGPDQDGPPPLPRYAPLQERGGQRQIEPIRHMAYNWFNFFENVVDPVHLWVLHRYSGFGQGTFGNVFFDYDNPPEWEPIETEFGLKIEMRKPGPKPDTEFIDTFTLGLPSIAQIGDTEFVHLKLTEAAIERGQNEHWMFLTPNDDDHFMLFTVDHYTGPVPDFFERLRQTRIANTPERQQRRADDRRPHMPYRGNIRAEDTMAQSTQAILGERSERLATSDRGVILVRKIVRQAILGAQAGRRPKGVLPPQEADRIIDLDSFVGVRASGRWPVASDDPPLATDP